MQDFERRIEPQAPAGLRSVSIDTLQVNVGLCCNQRCAHCHLGASPDRDEMMDWPTIELVLAAARVCDCRHVDITGGEPSLNPHLRSFIVALRKQGREVNVRTNLTALTEDALEGMPEFLRDHGVSLVGSMPCYLEENVTAQRGEGVYRKSVAAMRRLNALGYGRTLPLDLVYNPGGAFLPPDQAALEADYKRELNERFGIVFTRLLTIANMPLGRFRDTLARDGQLADYLRLLNESFNPATVDGLMCRRQVSVGWDGTLYDCDFNLALGLPVNHGAPDHVTRFDSDALSRRRIVTGEHCYGCTAGCGSSCGGQLV